MGILDAIRKHTKGKRVFLLGLDGTPYGLMKGFFEKGIMPCMAEIAGRGQLAKMSSTVPDVSSVAWTTFMTGVNPGRHGVFGFVDLKPGSYSNYFPNSTHVRSPTLWHLLGKEGKRSIIVNMPSTYPAQELQGVLIAGFVAIDLERATYPKQLVPWLKEIGYMLDVDASRARKAKDLLIEDLHTSLERSEAAIRKLMRDEPWDFFAAIITGTDRLHHFMWADYEDPASRHHSAFLKYYRAVDDMVGRFYDDLNGEACFLALSDHGFGRLTRDVYLNRWLEDEGYLRYGDPKRESVADIDPKRTSAFCLDPGRIYINLKRRFPEGSVATGRPYEGLRDELIEKFSLLGFSDNGEAREKVVLKVLRKEDLYHGPFMQAAPDLVLLGTRGNNLRGATGREMVFDPESAFSGMHTQDDAFFLADRPFDAPADLNILDASKTVLALLEASSTDRIEGRPLFSPHGL